MMATTNWKHLTITEHTHRGRDTYTTYTGFKDEDEIKEFGRYYDENWFVYFPKITQSYEKDGQWFCILRQADSCD